MPTRNFAFEKALYLLTKPAALAALLLLLVNDHFLRIFWPNWWTGKLGDAAWLFFTPFALAAVLAWIIPAWVAQREQRVFGLAFMLTGLVFTLAKTLPAAHTLLVTVLASLLKTPITLLRDPSDLLALPALVLAWQLYRRSIAAPADEGALQGAAPLVRSPAKGLFAMVAAALLTIANMSQPNPGIACLSSGEQGLVAATVHQSYTSGDGGLTWQPADDWPADCATSPLNPPEDWQTLTPTHSADLFRYRSGQPIQRSSDSGQTWQTAYQPPAVSEAGRAYLLKIHTGNPYYVPGPLAAIEDPQTGNLVFAMGYEGLLVYTRDGQWQWAEAGENRSNADFPDWQSFWTLVGGEAWLAVGAALIVFAGLSLRWLWAPARMVILVLGGLAWLGVMWILPPATTGGYDAIASGMGLLAAAILLVPLAIEICFRLARRQPQALLPTAATALVAGLLYLLPYGLWVLGIIPTYTLAALFALLLAAAAVVAGWRLQSKFMPAG